MTKAGLVFEKHPSAAKQAAEKVRTKSEFSMGLLGRG
jgi:hypothetical protein